MRGETAVVSAAAVVSGALGVPVPAAGTTAENDANHTNRERNSATMNPSRRLPGRARPVTQIGRAGQSPADRRMLPPAEANVNGKHRGPAGRCGVSGAPASAYGTLTVTGFQPSSSTSKSSAVRLAKAGLRTSLSQRASIVPVMYMSLPLSARINP